MTNTIKAQRKLLGLTQEQFADRAKIPLRTYTRYEADSDSKEHRIPDVVTAIRIADALGVKDLRELWGNPNISADYRFDRPDSQSRR